MRNIQRIKKRLLLIGIIISIIGAFLSLLFMDGKEVGLASLITIFVTGFGGGASLTAYITGIKNDRKKNINPTSP